VSVAKFRWWAMYVTSALLGCLAAVALSIMGIRVRWYRIGVNAHEHADAAARKEGPYLAPLSLALFIAGIGALTAAAIRWLS
jgi:hypothetical protein